MLCQTGWLNAMSFYNHFKKHRNSSNFFLFKSNVCWSSVLITKLSLHLNERSIKTDLHFFFCRSLGHVSFSCFPNQSFFSFRSDDCPSKGKSEIRVLRSFLLFSATDIHLRFLLGRGRSQITWHVCFLESLSDKYVLLIFFPKMAKYGRVKVCR